MGRQLYMGLALVLAIACVGAILIIVYWVNGDNPDFNFMGAWFDTNDRAQFSLLWLAALGGVLSIVATGLAISSRPECQSAVDGVLNEKAKENAASEARSNQNISRNLGFRVGTTPSS